MTTGKSAPETSVTTTLAPLGDIVTRWCTSGDGTQGTVLMLHSLGLDCHAFDPLRRALPSSWRIISYDQRGHGHATDCENFTLAHYVHDALLALDGIQRMTPLHLVGHSMGGAVAALAAARASIPIASLSLIATPPRGGVSYAARGDAVFTDGMASAIQNTLDRWFGEAMDSHASDAQAYAKATLAAMRPAGWAAAWRALATFEGYDILATRMPPTLALAGTTDRSTPPAVMQQIVDQFQRSGSSDRIELRTIDDVGHMLVLEKPQQVAEALTAHWCGASTNHRF